MNRLALSQMLEHEGYNEASDRVLDPTEDIVQVLNEYRPFVARYNDPYSRSALAVFQAIVAGETTIEN